jgi:hypothetical protein
MDIFTRYEISKSVMQTSSPYAVDTKFDKVRVKATKDADSKDVVKLNNLSVKEGSH